MEFNFTVFGAVLTVAGFLFGLYKWRINRIDVQRTNYLKAEEKQRSEINRLQDQRLQELSDKQRRHSEKIDALEELIQVTREEMGTTRIKLGQIEKLEKTIEKLEISIEHKLDNLHNRVGGIAKEVNQFVGAMKSMQENHMSSLVKDIRNALEKKDV